MRDPHRIDLFLIQCEKPVTQLRLQISVLQGTTLKNLSFGPLVVMGTTGTPELPVEPDPLPEEPNGLAIYQNWCQNCHTTISGLKAKNMNLQKLKTAIATQPLMGSLVTLTDAELNSLIAFVNQ
jgi:mono/diheme cytochrome c family protein